MRIISLTLCAAALVAGQAWPAPARLSGSAYVIDGDTLVIHATHVRLFGIDAFEHDQTCGRLACGAQAIAVMTRLTQASIVTCEKQDIDPYGRTVAVCTAAGVDLGREMVRRGLAVAYRRFSRRYMEDESYARAHRLGAWAYGFDSPVTWRRQHPRD